MRSRYGLHVRRIWSRRIRPVNADEALGLWPPVQSTLRFARSRPPTRTRIFARCDGPGAGPAPDRRVSLRDERVLGQVVILLVRRDLVVAPSGERVHLD